MTSKTLETFAAVSLLVLLAALVPASAGGPPAGKPAVPAAPAFALAEELAVPQRGPWRSRS